jgi:hypothetical protein
MDLIRFVDFPGQTWDSTPQEAGFCVVRDGRSRRIRDVLNDHSNSRHPWAEAFDWAARVMAVSCEMFVPGLAGRWLDRRWGTEFIGLLGFVFGIALGMYHLLHMTRVFTKPDRGGDREGKSRP